MSGPSRPLKVDLVQSRFEKTGSAVVAWWQRRSRGVFLPAGDPGDVAERRRPDDWPSSLPFRKRPKPYSRAIAWVPSDRRLRYVTDRSQPYELFVAQSVLRDVRSHLIGSSNSEPYGFLLGHVVYCPWTRAPYVVIDAVRRETHDAPHSGDTDSFRRSWASASREARRRRGQIIGWYHQHGVLGLHLSQSDLQLQEEFFPEAWHCALLIVPDRRGVLGGFIQRSGRASLHRKGISGFYELIDLDAKLIDGKKPSVVDWTNYNPEERVGVLPANWPAPPRRPRPTPHSQDEDSDQAPIDAATSSGAESRLQPPGALTARRWKMREAPPAKEPAPEKKPARKKKTTTSGKPVAGTKEAAEKKSAQAGATMEKSAKGQSGKGRAETAKEVKTEQPGEERAARAIDEQAATGSEDLGAEFNAALGPLDPEPDEAPDSEPVRPSLDADDRQVAEFLEAVWGPPPFEPEGNDAPVTELPFYRELMPTDVSEMDPTLDGVGLTTGLRDGVFRAEPAEKDPATGSLDWLLGLVEETLGAGFTGVDEAGSELDEAAGHAVEESTDEVAGGSREKTTEASPATTAGGSREKTTAGSAAEGSERQSAEDEGQAREPDSAERAASEVERTGRVGRDKRFTFVGASEDPDEDPEAEIPVVMPTDDGLGWLPILRRKRTRALFAAVLVISAVSAWVFLGRDQAGPPAFRTPAPVAPPTGRPVQAPEFIRLSGEFTAAITAYREREADFQLGRIDCTGLATGYETLAAAFAQLSQYVALAPSGSVDFGPFADDMRGARTRFEGSGCERAERQTEAPGS